MAGLVHLRGAPGLVLRQVGRDPGTLGVHHAVEPEGEDAGLVSRGSTETKMLSGMLHNTNCWSDIILCYQHRLL